MCQMLRSFYTAAARCHQILVILKKKKAPEIIAPDCVVSFVVSFSRQEEGGLWIDNLIPLLLFCLF